MARELLITHPMQGPAPRRAERGFTLTELMIVIVIMGILAAIAVLSFRKYVQSAKTSEVYTMLGDIRAKQEGYRAEFSQYCDVAAIGGSAHTLADSGRFPGGGPREDGKKTNWASPNIGWQQLGFAAHSGVYASYVVTAGLPSNGCSGCPTMNTMDHWWAAWGILDLDGDGTFSTYESINATPDIHIIQEGE